MKKIILIIFVLFVSMLNAQTSEFRRNFSTTSGAPLSGYTNYIFLVPQANTYPTGALALTEDGTRDGVYYRANVPDGEYKIYIDVDKAGAGTPTLYIENYWIGEKRLSTIADHFDATDSYKLKETGIKNNAVTESKIAPNAVVTIKIQDNSITTNKIISNAVTTDKIDDNSITTNKIATDGVQTSDIKDANITLPKLSPAVVDLIGSGGSITNNPDDVTLETKSGSTIGVKDTWWNPKQEKIDSLDIRTSNIVNVKEFGAVGNGVAEDSLAFQTALQYLYDNGGGTLSIPAGIYKISSLLEIPNDENYTIQQVINKAIKIQGAGAWSSGNAMGTKPIGGTILDLRYNNPAHPFKIISRGTGGLEISGITFTNKGTPDSCDFIRIIGTTSYIHHNSFYGTQASFNASNDAIVFGGTYEGEPPYIGNRSEDSSAYSGYGSMVTENFFDYIRRFAVLYTWTNGISFTNNTVWNHCGTNISGGGAWESYGADENDPNVGGVISGNLIEGGSYYTIFKLSNTGGMVFIGNNIYDETDSTKSVFDMNNYSRTNTIITGMHTDARYPNGMLNEDATSLNGNALFNNHSSQESYWTNPFVYTNYLRLRGNLAGLYFDNTSDYTQNFSFRVSFPSNPVFKLQYADTAGISLEDILSIRRIGGVNANMSLMGSGTINTNGDLSLDAVDNTHNVWIGTNNNVRVTDGVIYNSIATGTPPMGITSTTPVTNLTVQRVDSPIFFNIPSDSTGLPTGSLYRVVNELRIKY